MLVLTWMSSNMADSLRASSPIWASEASLARTRERGAEESRAPRKPRDSAKRLPLAASPRARAFSRDLFHSPKQESLLAGYMADGNQQKHLLPSFTTKA